MSKPFWRLDGPLTKWPALALRPGSRPYPTGGMMARGPMSAPVREPVSLEAPLPPASPSRSPAYARHGLKEMRNIVRNPPQLALLSLGFIVLAIISAAAVLLVIRERSDARVLAAAVEMRNELQLRQLQLLLVRAEGEQYRYLLTGNPSALESLQADTKAVGPVLAHIKGAVAGHGRPEELVAALEPLVRRKIALMRSTMDQRQQGDPDGALRQVQTGEGADLMDRIGAMADTVRAEEVKRLEIPISDTSWLSGLLLGVNVAGAALIVGLAAISITMAHRSTADLKEAHDALELANTSLEATVAERTAELSEANEEIQRFAHIVSHDLRSPLVNIMGFTAELEAQREDLFNLLTSRRKQKNGSDAGAEATKDSELEQNFEEALTFIRTSTTKMDRLITAILKLSREGRREYQPTAIDMAELVRSIVDASIHKTHELGASIEIGPLPSLNSDRLAVEQIFSNLLDNALKYLRAGEPGHIVVSGKAAGSSVTFQVRDNGRGIDPNDRERIFEPFRRSGSQDVPGEGIGLTYVKVLVRRLGGTIDFQSDLGCGTTFIVTLPQTLECTGRA